MIENVTTPTPEPVTVTAQAPAPEVTAPATEAPAADLVTNDALAAAVTAVADARARQDAADAEYAKVKAILDERIAAVKTAWEAEFEPAIRAAAAADAILVCVEDHLRRLGVEAFKQTGNKKPVPGFDVRETRRVQVDYTAAETWARANMPVLFKLDTKAYDKEKLTGKYDGMPGEIVVTPKVYIDGDLSGFVSAE